MKSFIGYILVAGLPRGRSIIRFHYAPPHIAWTWLVFWAGLASLAASGLRIAFQTRSPSPEI